MANKKPGFTPSKAAESAFARQLRKVARQASHIVELHVDGARIWAEAEMTRQLKAYSELIGPWAAKQSAKMLEAVSKKNRKEAKTAMTKNAKNLARLLRMNVAEAETGRVAAGLMDEQVFLIKSIPLRAGLRAQALAREAVYSGARAGRVAEIIQELDRTGEVSESDAMRIARTEVARSNAAITQTRAQAVGAHWYIWRTTMDGAERDSHREMNGEHVRYDRPPTLSDDTTGHAGTFVNCRCWQDPQFDDDEFNNPNFNG